MKKIILLCVILLTLTGCSKQKDEPKTWDHYSFMMTTQDFFMTLTDKDITVSDRSGTLSRPVRYEFDSGKMYYDGISLPFSAVIPSVLSLGTLIRDIYTGKVPCEKTAPYTFSGEFLGHSFTLKTDKDGMPVSIRWGNTEAQTVS